MDIIEINGLRVRAEVGFSPHELGNLQELEITIQLRTSIKKAGETDRVEDTVNYRTITKDVLFHVENKKYNLIEAVATDVARICVVRWGVPSVKVTVKKPNSLRFADSSSVTIERGWEDFDWQEAHISIGSNIDPAKNVPQAVWLLEEKVELLKLSKPFRTTPVGYKEQKEFINMAVLVRTKLDPSGLKRVLIDVEDRLGRIRDPNNKNGPRTIDLNISLWGDTTCDYKIGSAAESWALPDPDTLKHAHVIIPLADVTPDVIHPITDKSLKVLAAEVSGREDFASFFPVAKLGTNHHLSTAVHNGFSHSSESPQTCGPPVALVTGAAKRLGACIARRLHEVGFNIVVHYNTSVVEATAFVEEMNSCRGNSAQLVQGDLSYDTQATADRIIKESYTAWKRLDILVNNASQFFPTEVCKVNKKDWERLMDSNLSAPFFLSQAAFPKLKDTGGCIINLLDIHADRPLAGHSVYCISKAGLRMCTKALAKEFSPYVRVNGVAPGAILWPEQAWEGASMKGTMETKQEEILRKIPLGRRGEPNDVAGTVEFLARFADYVTGQVISVDGGRTLNQ